MVAVNLNQKLAKLEKEKHIIHRVQSKDMIAAYARVGKNKISFCSWYDLIVEKPLMIRFSVLIFHHLLFDR